MILRHAVVFFGYCALVVLACSITVSTAAAQSRVEQLQNQISTQSDRISDIDAEILRFEAQLHEVGAEKKTLQNAIYRLETERKKINAEITRTQMLITATDQTISQLQSDITTAQANIDTTEAAIGELVRDQYRASQRSVLEIFLAHDRLSDFMQEVDATVQVRNSLATHASSLHNLKQRLEEQQIASEVKRSELESLNSQYSEKNELLVSNKAEQSELLVATKNEEATYQQLLEEKQAAREQMLAELRQFESDLQFILDPSSIPQPGTSVFAWPLANVQITQYFGGTEFAARNPGVYGGRPYHTGVDFAAPRGTELLAPLTGTVRATGNTDAVPGCYSLGKWTLIDHANGLSTLYAHQDLISVSAGQTVTTGQVIGYTGNTGYSTGPHLHFGLYATDGVTIRRFNEIKTVTSCGSATTPTAAASARLDPMLFLPGY